MGILQRLTASVLERLSNRMRLAVDASETSVQVRSIGADVARILARLDAIEGKVASMGGEVAQLRAQDLNYLRERIDLINLRTADTNGAVRAGPTRSHVRLEKAVALHTRVGYMLAQPDSPGVLELLLRDGSVAEQQACALAETLLQPDGSAVLVGQDLTLTALATAGRAGPAGAVLALQTAAADVELLARSAELNRFSQLRAEKAPGRMADLRKRLAVAAADRPIDLLILDGIGEAQDLGEMVEGLLTSASPAVSCIRRGSGRVRAMPQAGLDAWTVDWAALTATRTDTSGCDVLLTRTDPTEFGLSVR